jgi:hypothetical protein
MARKVTSIYLVFDLEGEISSWFHGIKAAREYVKVQRFSREYSIVRFVRAVP